MILTRPFETKAVQSDGLFTGYASVFDEMDDGLDVVRPGAFVKSLGEYKASGRKVPILWQHNTKEPIGVYESLEEDGKGLAVKGQLNMDVQRAREAHSLLKQGALSGLSIGYGTVRFDRTKSGGRDLIELKLGEASLVTFPMLDSARVESVKSIEQLATLSDCESRLRDAGYSKSEAVAFVSRLKAISRSDSDGADPFVSHALSILQGIKS